MTTPQPMFTEATLDALIREADTIRPVPRAKHATTEFREFHGWTLNKLDVLALYFTLYRRVAGGGAFIDAFAGTGHGTQLVNGVARRRDGSSLIAARAGAFAQLHLIEKDLGNAQLLESATTTLARAQAAKITIHNHDCNDAIPDLIASGALDPEKPCFVLLDQESTQLSWTTIETLAAFKHYEPPPSLRGRPKQCKAELWILFNTQHAIARMWPRDRRRHTLPPGAATLDRVFGGRDAWIDLWEQNQPSSFLRHRYGERLRDLGYQYVLHQPINDPRTGTTQYHMIHATDHPSAVSFMRWAKSETSAGTDGVALPGI